MRYELKLMSGEIFYLDEEQKNSVEQAIQRKVPLVKIKETGESFNPSSVEHIKIFGGKSDYPLDPPKKYLPAVKEDLVDEEFYLTWKKKYHKIMRDKGARFSHKFIINEGG